MSQEVTVIPIQQVTREPTWVRWLLIAIDVGWFLALLLLPLATIFVQAFKQGIWCSSPPSASRMPSRRWG